MRDVRVRRMEGHVVKAFRGSETLKDKLRRWFFVVLHYTFTVHLPLVEHFPLESLFLSHYRPLRFQIVRLARKRERTQEQEEDLEEAVSALKELRRDFDYPGNVFLPDLQSA